MDEFTRKFVTEWRRLKLPFENETFLIAVSGGADSCALALALRDLKSKKKINNRFVMGHFDHCLRGKASDDDSVWVETFAEDLGFEFVSGVAQPGEITPNSDVEQSARDARYKFLFDEAVSIDSYAVLTGHTIDDQAETFLLNLLRGSGLKGLGGMKTVRDSYFQSANGKNTATLSKTRLIRPMIRWAKREDTEEFVKRHNVGFRMDSMNEDLAFKRVRIRKELIPVLRKFNPGIVETLSRTAEILSDENSLLVNYESDGQLSLLEDDEGLKIKEIVCLPSAALKRLIREWLSIHRNGLRALNSRHIESIASLAMSRKSGRKVELPGGESVVKHNGKLLFRQTKVEK